MANERLTLQIDGKTTGVAEIEKLATALNKVVSIQDRASQPKQPGEVKTGFENFPSQIKSLVQDPLASAEASLGSLVTKFGTAGAAIGGGVAILGSIVGASFSAARALADIGVQYEAVGIRTGMTTKEIAQFSFAARETESDISVLENAMRKLSEGLTDGGAAGKKTRDALDELGVKTRDVNGQFRPMSEIFRQIGSGLNATADPAKRTALGIAAIGRAYIEAAPVFLKLNDALKHAEELGKYGPSDAQLKKFNAFDDALDDLSEHWRKVKQDFEEGITGTVVLQGAEFVLKFLDKANAVLSSDLGAKDARTRLIDTPFYGTTAPGRDSMNNLFGTPGGGTYGGANYLNLGPSISRLVPGLPTPGMFAAAQAQALDVHAGGEIAARDKSAFEYTLPGAQTAAESAREKATKARLDYFDAAGTATSDALAKLKTAWQDAEKSATMYENRIKAINSGDSIKRHFQDVYRSLSGAGADDPVRALRDRRQAEIDKLNDPKTREISSPSQLSLYRNQVDLGFGQGLSNIIKKQSEDGEKAIQELADTGQRLFHEMGAQWESSFKEGIGPLGEMFSAGQLSADRVFGPGGTSVRPPIQRTSQDLIRDLQSDTSHQERMAGISSSGPGDQVALQQRLSDIRVDAADKERVLQMNMAHDEQSRFDTEVEHERRITEIKQGNIEMLADLRKQQLDREVNLVTGLARSALSGGKGISSFTKDLGTGIGETALSNFFKANSSTLDKFFPHAKEGTALGTLLKDTPFGPDANKATIASVTLNTAGTSLQAAARELTVAAGALRGGGVAGSGTQGSASRFGSFGGLPGLFSTSADSSAGEVGNIANDGLPVSPVRVFEPELSAGSRSPSGFSGLLSGLSHIGDLKAVFTGTTQSGDEISGAEQAGAAIGNAGVVAGGVMGAIGGFSRGGGKGITQGIASVAGTAAALDPEPISKAVLAGVALVSSFVGSVLGDPKQMRQEFITKTLGNAKFEQPAEMHVSMGLNGGYSDSSAWGDVRSSNFGPYPTGATAPSQWYRSGSFNQIPGSSGTPYGGPAMVINNHINGDVIDPQQFFDRNAVQMGNTMSAQFGTHTELALSATRATVGG